MLWTACTNVTYSYREWYLSFSIYTKSKANYFEKQLIKNIEKLYICGVQLLKRVENVVGNKEIANFEQYRLFPQWFQNVSALDVSECDWECERVNDLPLLDNLIFVFGDNGVGVYTKRKLSSVYSLKARLNWHCLFLESLLYRRV